METQERVEILTDHPHIIRVAGVCGGDPIVRGTRVNVASIFEAYRVYEGLRGVLEAMPFLTREQVFDALAYARDHPEEVGRRIVENEVAEWEEFGVNE
jgi:uncharacterized protein (DUF433 family)